MELQKLVNTVLEELDEMQAANIQDIDVIGKTSVADRFIVCTGRSNRHVKAVAEKVIERLKSVNYPPSSASGLSSGDWALIDFGDVILHVMTAEARAFYNIEGLWQTDESLSSQS